MDLDELRLRLNELDRQLVELMAERQAVVEKVGQHKRTEGRATRDYAREKIVLDGARDNAKELGIAPDVAEEVLRLLIQTSLTKQERERVQAEGQGRGRKAMVIGGGGKMGRWFADFLDSQGFRITVADPLNKVDGYTCIDDWQQAGTDFAITVVAAPLKISAQILQLMAGIGHRGLIFDIGSLKTPLLPALHDLAESGAKITSLHPMFGPDVELLSGRHVVFLDAGCPQATAEARELFAATMVQQTEMSLEDHDRLIAYVLGLSHVLNIAFFGVLAASGESVPRLADISSSTFDAQLEVASRVSRENPQLYFEIQSLNKHGLEPLEALQQMLQQIITSVREGDEVAFVELMARGRDYLAGRN